MHTVFALLCFVVVIHWLIIPYPSGLLHWHCGNLTIAPVPAKQPWWIWINTSCEFIMNDCITTTKQSTTKPCAYFLGYTVNKLVWLITVNDLFNACLLSDTKNSKRYAVAWHINASEYLGDIKPSPEPMMTYCQLDPWEKLQCPGVKCCSESVGKMLIERWPLEHMFILPPSLSSQHWWHLIK